MVSARSLLHRAATGALLCLACVGLSAQAGDLSQADMTRRIQPPLHVGDKIWRCSVSTCNSGRVKFWFCSVACWDAHLPTARHRNASAIEETAGKDAAKPPRPAKPR